MPTIYHKVYAMPWWSGQSLNWGSYALSIPLDAPPARDGSDFTFLSGATNFFPMVQQQRTGMQLTSCVFGIDPANPPANVQSDSNVSGFRFGHPAETPRLSAYRVDGEMSYNQVQCVYVMSGTWSYGFSLQATGSYDSPLAVTTGVIEVQSFLGLAFNNFIAPSDVILCLADWWDDERQTQQFAWVISVPSMGIFDYATIGAHPYFEVVEEGDEPEVPILVPDLPTLDASSAGVSLYKAGNFNALINYMWGTQDFLNAIEHLLGDETPYECIVAFNLFPYGNSLTAGSSENIHIGNVNTGISAPTCNQFCAVDFGSVTIPRVHNNALDFAPYTVVEVQLPFIGRVRVPTDFVMGHSLGVVYHCDVLTGGLCAFITVDSSVIQVEGGSCICTLPLSARTGDGARQAISSAASAGISFATAGGMSSKVAQVGGAAGGIGQIADALAAKDSYSTFSNLALANGYLGFSNPVVYVHRPVNATASDYNVYQGYAASTSVSLGSVSGFTRVKEINLGVSGATREDLNEIEALLKEGVIL